MNISQLAVNAWKKKPHWQDTSLPMDATTTGFMYVGYQQHVLDAFLFQNQILSSSLSSQFITQNLAMVFFPAPFLVTFGNPSSSIGGCNFWDNKSYFSLLLPSKIQTVQHAMVRAFCQSNRGTSTSAPNIQQPKTCSRFPSRVRGRIKHF